MEQIWGTYADYVLVKELTDALKAAFRDPHPKSTAQRLLTALRQGNQDFSRYLANFTLLSNHFNMTEETKIWTLRGGLSPGLKEEMRYRDKPTTLPAFITLLKKTDIKMKPYKAENHHHHHRPCPKFPPRTVPLPVPAPP